MKTLLKILHKLMRAVVVLTALAAVLGWLGLVMLGIEHSHSWLSVVALVVLLLSDGALGGLAGMGFAVWGAYAGLKLHWFFAFVLGVPIAPVLLIGLLTLVTELLAPRPEKPAP